VGAGLDPAPAFPPQRGLLGDPAAPEEANAPNEVLALDDALARCYFHLARREHSVAELRARLARAGIDERTASAAIEVVVEQGYLDDGRYARMLAEERRKIDGWGVERIRARLLTAGVDRELIELTLAKFDAVSECDAAVALLCRRFPRPLRSDPERQRAFAVLIRQGYESDVAYDAIRRHEREVAEPARSSESGTAR
jgi:regulatory protein